MTIFICSLGMTSIAKPIGWHASGTLEVGRKSKNCNGIWVCLKITDIGIGKQLAFHQGNPTEEEHGFGVGIDGKLYLIINKALLERTQPDKLELLEGRSSYYLDSNEDLPQDFLNAIYYRGSTTIKSGDKNITFENGYYFIQLN